MEPRTPLTTSLIERHSPSLFMAEFFTLARRCARRCECRVVLRRDELILSGTPEAVGRAAPAAERMIRLARMERVRALLGDDFLLYCGDDANARSAIIDPSGGGSSFRYLPVRRPLARGL